MALQKCPDCRHKISESTACCPHCGFSFAEADLEIYRQKLEQHRLYNRQINKKSAKLQLLWLLIFALIIAVCGWLHNADYF